MEGTVSKKDIFLNLALCGAPAGLLDVWMKFITVAVHCNCIFETTLTLTLFLFLRKCKHWFRLLWQGETLHILFSFLIWSKESFLFSLARPASGERLTSLEESLVRCFAFYKTSSKTSGAIFFKHRTKHCIVKQKVHPETEIDKHDKLSVENIWPRIPDMQVKELLHLCAISLVCVILCFINLCACA